jgi:protein-S-isoprenylcysteine O-methyltransferase Ste14
LGPGRRWPDPIASRLRVLGILLIGAGFVLALAGIVELRRNLSPLPAPKSTGALVTTGAYRLARHPIYGGLTLIGLGWSFTFGGWATLISAAALLVLLERKSAREESLLLGRFPGYEAYRRRTRRFLPFVY